ncbi:MAG: NADH-quinone oxidoreductase subunit H, partial [Candidatus Diapherotrites archaeon]|nr:NADH-quinone oxidoreductase subunit H [Candidatus Diapherotrites archaeon]
TEYSGRDFGFFYLSGIIKSFALSALVIALFFPYTFSWLLPTQDALVVVVWDILVFLFKVFVLMFFSITLVRSTFARFRIEQASRFLLGWLLLISLIGLLLVVLDKVYPIALGVSL